MRTAFVIGTLATSRRCRSRSCSASWPATSRAGSTRSIQYLYTVLVSVPNVLLIAACVLMIQVFLDKHPRDVRDRRRARRRQDSSCCASILGLDRLGRRCAG